MTEALVVSNVALWIVVAALLVVVYALARQIGVLYERVEEGHYDASGKWVFERVWNGDQTDYGLNFTTLPQVLRVKLAAY